MADPLSLHTALTADDYTKPGETIPKDAGLSQFLNYNAAHFDPSDPSIYMGASGGIKSIGGKLASLLGISEAEAPSLAKALSEHTGTAMPSSEAYKLLEEMKPQVPQYQVNPEEVDTLLRRSSPSVETPGKIPKESYLYDSDFKK
jgi:hypothetical protein